MWLCVSTWELIYTGGSRKLTKDTFIPMLCNKAVNIWRTRVAPVQPFIISKELLLCSGSYNYIFTCVSAEYNFIFAMGLHISQIFFVLLSPWKFFWMHLSGERQWRYTGANSSRYLNQLLDECKQMSRWQLAGVYSFIFKCWTMCLIYLLCVSVAAFNFIPAIETVLSQICRWYVSC